MKRNDWILATAVLLVAGVLGAYLLLGRQTGSYVMISKDNEEMGTGWRSKTERSTCSMQTARIRSVCTRDGSIRNMI